MGVVNTFPYRQCGVYASFIVLEELIIRETFTSRAHSSEDATDRFKMCGLGKSVCVT